MNSKTVSHTKMGPEVAAAIISFKVYFLVIQYRAKNEVINATYCLQYFKITKSKILVSKHCRIHAQFAFRMTLTVAENGFFMFQSFK